MTGSMTHLLSLSIVSITAYVTSNLLKSEPIYDSLLENRISEQQAKADDSDRSKKVTVELVVHFGSPAEGKLVKELDLPENCLLIAVRRGGEVFIPNGSTRNLRGFISFLLGNVFRSKDKNALRMIMSSSRRALTYAL
jgi:Trk K+ transport system NAD-binding subunit